MSESWPGTVVDTSARPWLSEPDRPPSTRSPFPPGSVKYNARGEPYAPDLDKGAGKVSPEVIRGFAAANAAGFDTKLSPAEETAFKAWKGRYAPKDSGADYDLRGAFKAGLTPDPATGHWPDTYKKPNHPTFSDQSMYATGANAAKAGRWEGQRFIGPGTQLTVEAPPEADALFARVRKAEGTAQGSGYVYYGGDAFTPTKDHPGAAARRPGLPGKTTSAAGPGQWEEDTWNGLKPDFQSRFGREPDFSSADDQKRMTWVNAAKVYPGGEAALRRDIAAGKLDTSKLAGQWTGFGQPTGSDWAGSPIAGGTWRVDPNAIKTGMARTDGTMWWLPASDFSDGIEPTETSAKRKSLKRDLEAGGTVKDVPELEVTVKDGRAKITGHDGANRAAYAAEQLGPGGLIPVFVKGIKGEPPSWIEDAHGNVRPFNYEPVSAPVDRAQQAGGPPVDAGGAHRGAMARMGESLAAEAPTLDQFLAFPKGVALGAAHVGSGAASLLEHGAAALGIPGAEALAKAGDAETARVGQAISDLPAGGQMGATGGDVAATMAMPMSRLGQIARTARPLAASAGGAIAGAVQPVADAANDYWGQVKRQAATGALLGGGLQLGGEGISALWNLARGFVTKGTLTAAASRLLGLGEKTKITDDELHGMFRAVGNALNIFESRTSLFLGDQKLKRALDAAKNDGRDLGGDGQAIVNAVNDIKTRFSRSSGLMPGDVAASFWHEGGSIDRLTKRANPDIRRIAQKMKDELRDAFSRRMTPEDAAMYAQLRAKYRDLKVVAKARVADQVEPRQLIRQVEKRFPRERPIPDAAKPQVLRLAQAAERTFRPTSESWYGPRHAAGTLLGGGVGTAIGGPVGTGVGMMSGHLLVDALLRSRYARGNALAALRPSGQSAPLSLGQYAAPVGAAGAMMGQQR